MIKFRLGTLFQKLFYRAEITMWDLPIDDDGNPILFTIKVESSKKFENGRKNCTSSDKIRIKRYLSDLENISFITGNNFSDFHFSYTVLQEES